MKKEYEKPELVVYEDLSDVTTGGPISKTVVD
jgi:hypothetical protein